MKESNQLRASLSACRAVLIVLTHHLVVETPHVARVRLQAKREADEATCRLFVSDARLLEC